MSVAEAAAGIRRIVDMRMADEVRVFAAKRGVDAQDFTLLPFGGAGAVHAAAVAEELGMQRILVPPRPGAFSALGLLCTDVVHDYIRSELRPLDQVAPDHAEAIFRRARSARRGGARRGRAWAPRRRATSASSTCATPARATSCACRSRASAAARSTAAALAAARARFDEAHAQIHGHAARERPVEIVSYRLRVRVAAPKYTPRAAARARARGAAPKAR